VRAAQRSAARAAKRASAQERTDQQPTVNRTKRDHTRANYRLIYHVRVGALSSEDARFEAWEFSANITAPMTPDYAMDQGMTRSWSVCLDRAGGSIDCAAPAPAERFGRVSWTNLVAAQSG